MQKKLPYILAIVLPFLVVWPLSVILLPQAQTKLHLWVIGIALFIVIFFAVWRGNYSKRCKRAWRLLSVAMIASALLFWAIDTTNSTLVPDLRFHLFEQQYQAEAERISTALSEVPDQYRSWRGKSPATCWPWMGCSTWTKVSQGPCCFSTHS